MLDLKIFPTIKIGRKKRAEKIFKMIIYKGFF
jgi:hypothetical protein